MHLRAGERIRSYSLGDVVKWARRLDIVLRFNLSKVIEQTPQLAYPGGEIFGVREAQGLRC